MASNVEIITSKNVPCVIFVATPKVVGLVVRPVWRSSPRCVQHSCFHLVGALESKVFTEGIIDISFFYHPMNHKVLSAAVRNQFDRVLGMKCCINHAVKHM